MNPQTLDPAQADAWEAIAGPRGDVPLPYHALLAVPQLATHVAAVGAQLRYAGTLPDGDREFAICATGFVWNARYEWFVHAPVALAAGVTARALDAIRSGTDRAALTSRERLILAVVEALAQRRTLDDELHVAARRTFGETGLTELVAIAGFYGMLACVLNAYDLQPPASTPTF